MIQNTVLNIPKRNRDFETVKVSMTGINPTQESDFKAIDNLQNITCNSGIELVEHDFYGDSGKTKSKGDLAPEIELEFVWSGSDVHKYLYESALKTNEEGYTQVEAELFNGNKLYYIATITSENFGPDGAPSDDAVVKITLSHATGNVKIEVAETPSNPSEPVVPGE